MVRKPEQRIKELMDSGVKVYSISRLDCINRCLYEAFETYRRGNRGEGNIYALCGSKVHDVLEGIVNGSNTKEDLLPAVNTELDEAEMLGYEFPKMPDGSDGIRTKWIDDINHFCTHYEPPKVSDNLSTEELFIYKSPKGNVLQGYIDLQKKNKDGSVDIYDYKTSSLYTGNAIKEHGRQLVVYQMGLEQAGVKVNSASWIFLKYVEIKFKGKKTVKSKEKTEISKVVERCKIGSEMAKYVEQVMIEKGFDEVDIEIALKDFRTSNSFTSLPEEVEKEFKMLPYVCKYEITDEIKKECEEYIDDTIEFWESLGSDENDYPPLTFTKQQKNGKMVSDTFYCSKLCAHRRSCRHLQDYLYQSSFGLDIKTDNEYNDLF